MLNKNGWLGDINYTKTGVLGEKSQAIDSLTTNPDSHLCIVQEESYCSQCGQKSRTLAKFCSSCGAKL